MHPWGAVQVDLCSCTGGVAVATAVILASGGELGIQKSSSWPVECLDNLTTLTCWLAPWLV